MIKKAGKILVVDDNEDILFANKLPRSRADEVLKQ